MFYNKYLWLCPAFVAHRVFPLASRQISITRTLQKHLSVSSYQVFVQISSFHGCFILDLRLLQIQKILLLSKKASVGFEIKYDSSSSCRAFKYRISVASTFYFTFYHCLIIRWHDDLKTSSHLSNPDFLTFSISTPQIPQNRQFLKLFEANSALLRRKRWTFAIRNFQLLEKCI